MSTKKAKSTGKSVGKRTDDKGYQEPAKGSIILSKRLADWAEAVDRAGCAGGFITVKPSTSLDRVVDIVSNTLRAYDVKKGIRGNFTVIEVKRKSAATSLELGTAGNFAAANKAAAKRGKELSGIPGFILAKSPIIEKARQARIDKIHGKPAVGVFDPDYKAAINDIEHDHAILVNELKFVKEDRDRGTKKIAEQAAEIAALKDLVVKLTMERMN